MKHLNMKTKLIQYFLHFMYHLYIDSKFDLEKYANPKQEKILIKEIKLFLKTHPYKSWL